MNLGDSGGIWMFVDEVGDVIVATLLVEKRGEPPNEHVRGFE